MGSPMYFLIALTIIIGAATRSGPFAISSVQLNNKHTRTLIKTENGSQLLCHSMSCEHFQEIRPFHDEMSSARIAIDLDQ